MSNSLLPDDLAWLRQCAAVEGNTYDRLLLHLMERVESLEARPIPGAVELVPSTPEPAPPAAPAGGLVERVCGEMTGDDDPSIDARAAIREVAEWVGEQSIFDKPEVWAERLRQEADQ